MFGNLSDRLTQSFRNLRSRGVLTESDVDQAISDIRRALIEADVALPVVRQFTSQVREKAYGAARSKALNPGQQVVSIVHDELVEILGGATRELAFAQSGPTVFMLAGLQGAGKTTLAGKLGKWLREEGKTVLLVASDLQRPNAVQQLQVVGERAGVKVWAPEPGNGVGNPVEVARSGVEFARQSGINVVIVDTAGRLGVDQEMMKQAIAIRDAVSPHEIMFVLDAMVGQDAVSTSTAFRDGVGFTGVVLSKLDGDARGGAALSIRHITGKPIKFLGVGEKTEALEPFHPDRIASRILGMGDVLSLIEDIESKVDRAQAEKLASKLKKGDGFDLNDFLEQLRQMKNMGGMASLMGKLPGMGQIPDNVKSQMDDKVLVRMEAIINSMTMKERAKPEIIKGSRKRRIAAGCGMQVQDVNRLLKQFDDMQRMMKKMKKGGMAKMMRSMKGMMPPGFPGR